MLTTINTRSEATQKIMAAKLTRLTHRVAIQLHLVAESCTICSSRSRRLVRKFLNTPSWMALKEIIMSYLKVPFKYFPGGNEENHEKRHTG